MRNDYQYIDPDYADVYDRYMSGTIESDVDKLERLIEELIEL